MITNCLIISYNFFIMSIDTIHNKFSLHSSNYRDEQNEVKLLCT